MEKKLLWWVVVHLSSTVMFLSYQLVILHRVWLVQG